MESCPESRRARLFFVTYGLPAAGFGLLRSVTTMFENMAAWVVLVLFAVGLWLTGHAIWGMAADKQARRVEVGRFSANRPPSRP